MHPGASPPWRPANALEVALQEALAGGDTARYQEVLAQAPLLVPLTDVPGEQPPGGGQGGDGPGGPGAGVPALASARLDSGAVAVPVYTSPEGLTRPEAQPLTGHHAATTFAELVRQWPDPDWLLAVNAGLPIATHLYGAELAAVLATVFAPVNDTERALATAGSPGAVLAALAGAELLLPVREGGPREPSFPWLREDAAAGEDPVPVLVFTSPRRLDGWLGLTHPGVEAATVDLLAVADAWAEERWLLVVNPGAPYQVSFTAQELRVLAERLPPVLGRGLELQVLVPPDLVPAYLERGYGTAAGMVHLRPSRPRPLAARYEELGLDRPGSPFSASDALVHAIRWRAEAADGAAWVRDATPRTRTVQLPAGAELVELRADGSERPVAVYQPDLHGWTPIDRPG